MKGGPIYRRALSIVREKDLPYEAESDLVAVLEASLPGTTEFSYALGLGAGLSRDDVLLRGAAIQFISSAVNLTDDLADGDASYIGPKSGSTVQFLLQNLFFEVAIAKAHIPSNIVSRAAQDLIAAAGAELVEIKTENWTETRAKQVCEGIGGKQCSAYTRILWHDTPFENRAEQVGRDIGNVMNIGHDLRSHSTRFFSLSNKEQTNLFSWAQDAIDRLHELKFPQLDAIIRSVAPYYETVASSLQNS